MFKNSIRLRLVVTIGGLLALAGLIFWYKFVYKVNTENIGRTVEEINTYLEIIGSDIEGKLGDNHIEAVKIPVKTLQGIKDIPVLRLIDHKGNIRYSSDEKETAKSVNINSATCRQCHTSGIDAAGGAAGSPNARTPIDAGGRTPNYEVGEYGKNWYFTEYGTLKAFLPLVNKKACYTAPCHRHPESGPKGNNVLGIVEAEQSMSYLNSLNRERNFDALIIGVIFTALIVITIYVMLYMSIKRPATALADGMRMVSNGYLNHSVEALSEDEIGELSESFNEMARKLKIERDALLEKIDALTVKAEEIKKTEEQYMYTEKLASLGRMAAGVAHELNSPLTGIIIFAQLLLKRTPPDDKSFQDDLKVIVEQAEKCSNIIAVLLGYSRTIPSKRPDVDINRTILNAMAIVASQAKFYGITIEQRLAPLLPVVPGDSSHIEQVFINLLINAADAMESRGAITVTTGIVDEGGAQYAEISFADTGCGIPPENIARVFEPFYTTKPEGKGTGLGLAVSDGIVRKFGGRIIVQSAPGCGSTFTVRLPLARPLPVVAQEQAT
jgi:two-component system NtrC family sensor kinase